MSAQLVLLDQLQLEERLLALPALLDVQLARLQDPLKHARPAQLTSFFKLALAQPALLEPPHLEEQSQPVQLALLVAPLVAHQEPR